MIWSLWFWCIPFCGSIRLESGLIQLSVLSAVAPKADLLPTRIMCAPDVVIWHVQLMKDSSHRWYELGVVPHFCYVGFLIWADSPSSAGGKFKKLLPILTSKHLSLTAPCVKCSLCVYSVYTLHYYMVVKPRRPLLQTCSIFVEMTEPWSNGFAAFNLSWRTVCRAGDTWIQEFLPRS